ncbi:MAG: hypothetical protein CMJ32_03890 [Phycisphaerae bacterium]|nr:hypothetical protein [Phycisphaerae bacterium]
MPKLSEFRQRMMAPLLLVLMASSPCAGQYEVEPFDAAVQQLSKAVRYRPNNQNHALLLSLRELKDPSLRPLFQALIQSEHWTLQVNGMLGLGEIDPAGCIDPYHLKQLDQPAARLQAMQQAVFMELLGTEQISQILGWDDLQPIERIILYAELQRNGIKPDLDALGELARSEEDEIAGLASLLLNENGDAKPLDAFQQRLGKLTLRRKSELLAELARVSEQCGFENSIVFFMSEASDTGLTMETKAALLSVILSIDPGQGVKLWQAIINRDRSQRTLMRFGMILLGAHDRIPASTYDQMRNGDVLLEAMANAGEAMSNGTNQAGALISLNELRHHLATTWAIEAASTLPEAEEQLVLLHLIEQFKDVPGTTSATFAIMATNRLMQINPDLVGELLLASDSSGNQREVLLQGLLRSDSDDTSRIAGMIEGSGSRHGNSIALILLARDADSLEQDQLTQLGRIGAGGGRVDQMLQIQAAWLFIKHSGQQGKAMAELFASKGNS